MQKAKPEKSGDAKLKGLHNDGSQLPNRIRRLINSGQFLVNIVFILRGTPNRREPVSEMARSRTTEASNGRRSYEVNSKASDDVFFKTTLIKGRR